MSNPKIHKWLTKHEWLVEAVIWAIIMFVGVEILFPWIFGEVHIFENIFLKLVGWFIGGVILHFFNKWYTAYYEKKKKAKNRN